jgi:hypothetical protein
MFGVLLRVWEIHLQKVFARLRFPIGVEVWGGTWVDRGLRERMTVPSGL